MSIEPVSQPALHDLLSDYLRPKWWQLWRRQKYYIARNISDKHWYIWDGECNRRCSLSSCRVPAMRNRFNNMNACQHANATSTLSGHHRVVWVDDERGQLVLFNHDGCIRDGHDDTHIPAANPKLFEILSRHLYHAEKMREFYD